MDGFFTKKICDRCKGPLTVKTISVFNTDVICKNCYEKERKRPDYKKALEAVREAEKTAILISQVLVSPMIRSKQCYSKQSHN